jgi:hypothetical protein
VREVLRHCVRDLHPSSFLLLPDGHDAHWLLRKGLASDCALSIERVGDDKRVGVQFDLEVAQGIIAELNLLYTGEGFGAIVTSGWRDGDVVSGNVAAEFVPMLVVNFFPEAALEAFASSSFFPAVHDGLFMPDGACGEQQQRGGHDAQAGAKSHGGILSRTSVSHPVLNRVQIA